MTNLFELDDNGSKNPTIIKVIGVGGAGVNAINHMIKAGIDGIEFVAVNTDIQHLKASDAPLKIEIGTKLTKGLGAGANPEIGQKAAMEDRDRIEDAITDADMIFITCGMGGGTGTGASSVIADIAKENGILTVGVVTKPYDFEKERRMQNAVSGIESLKEIVDSLIVIPNNKLFELYPQERLNEAFRIADDVLRKAVAGIAEIITVRGFINTDFADVRTIMSVGGDSLMGIGEAEGENRAIEAMKSAIECPLIEANDIKGARGLLVNIMSGYDFTVQELKDAQEVLDNIISKDANVIYGHGFNEKMEGRVKITVVATGFPSRSAAVNKLADKTLGAEIYSKASNIKNFKLNNQVEIPAILRKQKGISYVGSDAEIKEEYKKRINSNAKQAYYIKE